jgi:glucose/arabinose dehydrogenase
MLVTERPGRLRLIHDGALDANPVEGIPTVRSGGLQGLMDVVLHPRFQDNHWVYFSYHRPVGENAGETMLARGRWENDALVDVSDIFATGATGTEGSRIGFAADGMLHMTVSAPGVGPEVVRSQDPKDYAGKTIRLRDDGSIPRDNPFVNDARYLPAIYTLGHRNGHSMVLNPWTNELWATEQGPNGGDEINVLQSGGNYGWPLVSYGRVYSGPRVSANPTRDGMVPPLVFWVPSIAVTGMTFYQGDVFTAWRRNAFVGGLREGEVPRTGQLQRIEFNDRWEEIRRETLLRELNQRIRDVREGPDGLLYVLTAEADGAVLRIEPAH